MSQKFIAVRPGQIPWTNVVRFQGDAFLGNSFHRTDKKHTASLIGRIANRDEVWSTARVVKDSFEDAASMPIGSISHQFEMQADIHTGAFKDNADNPFDGFRDTL
jgi:hypothetical protein